MGISAEQKKIRTKEKRIGRKAARLVEAYLKSKIASSLNIRNKGGGKDWKGREIKPIMHATKVKDKTGKYRLLGLNFTSNKYAFVHHYGVSNIRKLHTVERKKPNHIFFFRGEHPFSLKKQDFFSDMYVKSGALSYLINKLGETRAEAFTIKIKDLVKKHNNQNERNKV